MVDKADQSQFHEAKKQNTLVLTTANGVFTMGNTSIADDCAADDIDLLASLHESNREGFTLVDNLGAFANKQDYINHLHKILNPSLKGNTHIEEDNEEEDDFKEKLSYG